MTTPASTDAKTGNSTRWAHTNKLTPGHLASIRWGGPAQLLDDQRRWDTAMRQLAPQLLVTGKTQRWVPEGLLRTLIEAELAACDASNARNRVKAARFPVNQDPRRVRPVGLRGQSGGLRLPRQSEMDHRL